jgi:cytochrome P450
MVEDGARRSGRVGARISLEELENDPYPVYARLRESEPVAWVDALRMWYVTRYSDVEAVLLDTDLFTTVSEHSTIFDTFGEHMLTSEGVEHARYRQATQKSFMPASLRQSAEPLIGLLVDRLIESFGALGHSELRASFASRLPIQTMLMMVGLPLEDEPHLRRWYDDFGKALANFTGDQAIRAAARHSVTELHSHLDRAMRALEGRGTATLLGALVNAAPDRRLTDEEIKRNAAIILFGGISTVEALILNSLWALFQHPEIMARVRTDLNLLPRAIDETIRWLSPVQSATRHVTRDTEFRGVRMRAGDIVNCMIGAANRDPRIFREPDRFDIERIGTTAPHLGFATGSHMCLGFRLARVEARIALERLLTALPGMSLIPGESSPPEGYEFRQPRTLTVSWNKTAV